MAFQFRFEERARKDISMAEAAGSDLLYEFDLISEELVELLEAGLPKGHCPSEDDAPEGWDSKQIVAHMAEWCEFWRRDVEEGLRRPRITVLGRSALDEDRSRRIEALSAMPTSELIDRMTLEIGKTAGLLASLEAKDFAATVTHLTDGQITIDDMVSKHLIAHLGEHLAQLKELEETPPTQS
ncbi:MAG: DinB family protein [Actinomycetota bacterium]|nr:MAG: DinB family protein [Actinomycetota bacterium]